jgi:hypothetical protein
LRQDRHGAGDELAEPGIDRTTWFASFAPYENPRYAVVVMDPEGRTFWRRNLRADCARHLRGNFEKENAPGLHKNPGGGKPLMTNHPAQRTSNGSTGCNWPRWRG